MKKTKKNGETGNRAVGSMPTSSYLVKGSRVQGAPGTIHYTAADIAKGYKALSYAKGAK